MKSLKAIPIIVALASLGGALYCLYKIYSEHKLPEFSPNRDTDGEDDFFDEEIYEDEGPGNEIPGRTGSRLQYDFMNTHGYADADDKFNDQIKTAEDHMFVDSKDQA
ncbi:MAG: hypothetical protein Q4E47_00475 [Candidatus Saccharibacteria bacterium]|nr:hypothetical protein [Candidatus Saccharibacteria bacterium]